MNRLSVCAGIYSLCLIPGIVRGALAAAPRAFPGAEGFGAISTGGRGGAVYHVSNLEDAGRGSLRHGIDTANGPTTIVFDIGGTIQLKSMLMINKNNLTLAGQTAPGGGVTVAGYGTLIGGSSDVVVRYMRFRAGDWNAAKGVQDSLSVADSQRVIIDHVSASWGLDESLSVTRSNFVTVQNCIIAETLNPAHHAYGSLVRGNIDAANPGGYTFYRNLWIHNDRRNPAFGSYQQTDKRADLELDLVNNLIYNWGVRAIHTVESRDSMRVNLVGNMFIAGPSSRSAEEVLRVEALTRRVRIYETGNLIDSDKDKTHNPHLVARSMFRTGIFAGLGFESQRFAFPAVKEQLTAEEACRRILASAGASLRRDGVDKRLIEDVQNRTGALIVSQQQPGGLPRLESGETPIDSDDDGMPDSWETARKLNPGNAADGNGTAINGYSNLENYLDALTQG